MYVFVENYLYICVLCYICSYSHIPINFEALEAIFRSTIPLHISYIGTYIHICIVEHLSFVGLLKGSED